MKRMDWRKELHQKGTEIIFLFLWEKGLKSSASIIHLIPTSWDSTPELESETIPQDWAHLFINLSLQSCQLESHVENRPSSHKTLACFHSFPKLIHTKHSLCRLAHGHFSSQARSIKEALGFAFFFSAISLFCLDWWNSAVTNSFRAFGIHVFCLPPLYKPLRFSLLTRKCFGLCDTNSEVSPHNFHGYKL